MKDITCRHSGKRRWMRGVLMAVFWGTATLLWSQQFALVDQRIRSLFEQKDWPALTEQGETALQQGLDYLGLRYLLGVAYYEQGKYFNSTAHLEAALTFDSYCYDCLAYLYYSYLFSGREKDARLLASRFPEKLLEKTGNKHIDLLDFFYLEAGVKRSDLPDSIGAMPFYSFGVKHRLGYRLDLYQGATYLEQKYLYTDFRQWEYYLRADWQLQKTTTLHPAIHYIGLNGHIGSQEDSAYFDPLRQSVWSAYLGLTVARDRWRFHPYFALTHTTTTIDYLQDVPPFALQNEARSNQWGLGVNYTPPIWKDRFRVYAQGSILELQSIYNTLWSAGVSVYPSGFLAMHCGYFTSGGATQFVEAQGAVVNTAPRPVDDRWSATLELRFRPACQLLLGYQLEKKTQEYFVFNYHVFFLGLKLDL